MKKTLTALILAASLLGLQAQTNSPTPPATFNDIGVTFPQWLNLTIGSIESSGILQATNYAIAPYFSYAPKAAEKYGGGVLAVYNVPSLTAATGTNGEVMAVGAALGLDWLGQWSLVSGNVTVKADTHPFANIGLFSWLPASVKGLTMTPIAIAGIGQPMSGSSGAATIWDIGDSVRFGHWLGGQFDAGATWGEWMNAGAYSGHRFHFFVAWTYGIPHS